MTAERSPAPAQTVHRRRTEDTQHSPIVVEALDRSDAVVLDLRNREPDLESGRHHPNSVRFLRRGEGLLGASGPARLVKRALDIVGATVLLTVLGPVMLVIAMLIKITTPGPVLFTQQRIGRDGARFRLLKFRTMYIDAEERLVELRELNEQDGPVFKIRNDPRVTGLGRHLRRLSLDELPQLFNVLAGSMSLVGPRPPLPEEVDTYDPWELQRLLVKPGLTCIWQVSGRSEVDFETWVGMDVDYIGDWSIWIDLKLLLLTVPAVIKRDGAY